MESKGESELQIFSRMRQQVLSHQRSLREQIISDSRRVFEGEPISEEISKGGEVSHPVLEVVERPFRASVDSYYQPQPATDTSEPSIDMPAQKQKQPKKPLQTVYARRFQVPGWLNCIPEDFGRYLLLLKPSGARTLLFITSGKVEVRDKHGYSKAQFYTDYFGKSPMTTVLEAIYNPFLRTYYILDLIQWKGSYMTAEEAQFRLHWLASNLAESAVIEDDSDGLKIKLIPVYQNTKANLMRLYSERAQFQKEGFIFIHPQSKYLHRSNEGVLCWKDPVCSEYPIDTEDDGKTISLQVKATGVVGKTGALLTLDGHKVWQFSGEVQGGEYCRFGFTNIRVFNEKPTMEEEGKDQKEMLTVELDNFRVISRSISSKKCLADPLSKLVYQYRARHNPLRLEEILAALPE